MKWAQWDKTQSRELLGLFICVCIALYTMLHTILHRTDLIISPLTLQTITIAPIMSIWRKGESACRITWPSLNVCFTCLLQMSGVHERSNTNWTNCFDLWPAAPLGRAGNATVTARITFHAALSRHFHSLYLCSADTLSVKDGWTDPSPILL